MDVDGRSPPWLGTESVFLSSFAPALTLSRMEPSRCPTLARCSGSPTPSAIAIAAFRVTCAEVKFFVLTADGRKGLQAGIGMGRFIGFCTLPDSPHPTSLFQTSSRKTGENRGSTCIVWSHICGKMSRRHAKLWGSYVQPATYFSKGVPRDAVLVARLSRSEASH